MGERLRVLIGDALEQLRTLPSESVQCVVTSPPYYALRDYGVEGQLGLEESPEKYLERLTIIFAEVRRVLRPDGVCWLNLGDTYAGAGGGAQGKNGACVGRACESAKKRTRSTVTGVLKPKDMIGIPWRAALAMQADGWWLRADVVWSKPNPLPEPVRDRPSRAHEYVFLLSKSERYFYDADAVREPLAAKTATAWGTTRRSKGTDALGRVASHKLTTDTPNRRPRVDASGMPVGANLRTVWTIASQPYDGAHFATMPPRLAERCILAGSRPGDVVLDPFAGSGTTLEVALRHGRHALGIELSAEYAKLIEERTRVQLPLLAEGA